ncbi:MAG: hypothetical protein JWQ60_2168, partial [Pseudonocardia sp.]|nr:hypothetical protein [Pseudonocardia sp.]
MSAAPPRRTTAAGGLRSAKSVEQRLPLPLSEARGTAG